jgi:hypothetical protein
MRVFRGQPRIGLRSDLGRCIGNSHNPSDIPVKILVPVDGSPASLRTIKADKGTRGLGGIGGLLLGSVSTQVRHLVGDAPVTLLK